MNKYIEIDNRMFIRFKSQNLWLEIESDNSRVYSYKTYIGFIDWQNHIFNTWGYKRYSRTTSKQITTLCKYYGLKLNKIEELL